MRHSLFSASSARSNGVHSFATERVAPGDAVRRALGRAYLAPAKEGRAPVTRCDLPVRCGAPPTTPREIVLHTAPAEPRQSGPRSARPDRQTHLLLRRRIRPVRDGPDGPIVAPWPG